MERSINLSSYHVGTSDDWLMRSVAMILLLLFHFSKESVGMASHTIATDIQLAPRIMSIVWATIRKATSTEPYNYLQPFDLSYIVDMADDTSDTAPPISIMCEVIFAMIKSVLESNSTYIPDWEGIRMWIDQFISSGIATVVPFTDSCMAHWWGVNAFIIGSFYTLSENAWYRALCYSHSNDPVNIRSLLSLCDRRIRDVLRWLHENNRMPQAVSSEHIATIMQTMYGLWWNYKWLAPYVMADIYGKPREYWDRFKAHPHFALEYAVVDYLEYQCGVYERLVLGFPTELARIIAAYLSDECGRS